MSEKKLTVAELMARAAEEGHSASAPKRRRRRSLDDGGISVAELTGSIPAVKDKPTESKHSSVPIDATPAPTSPQPHVETKHVETKHVETKQAEAKQVVEAPHVEAERPAPSDDKTMILSIVDEKDPIQLTTGAFPAIPPSKVEQPTEAEPQPDFAPAETGQMPAISDEELIAEAERAAPVATAEELNQDDAAEPEKISIVSVLLMAVVGVVLGIALFFAFEMLWERLNYWLVGLMGVAVTLGLVGIVHALRTSRDGFSMVLAGIVGVAMTFGPLLLVL